MTLSIAISGASGFIGQTLTSELRKRGHKVRAVVRTSSFRRISGGFQSDEVVPIDDIGPETDWAAAVADCGAVVHLAACVHMVQHRGGRLEAEFYRVNVAGTETLARAAARAGVRRFVYLSSVKVNGESTVDRPFVEDDPPAPADAYAESKAQAEKKLWQVSRETGMEVVILRPPLVYGPGVKANFLGLLKAIDRRWPLPLGSIENRRSLVYVGNLASAIETSLTHSAAINRTFFVSDNDDVSTPQLVREIAASMGKRPLLLPFPPALLRGAALLVGKTRPVGRLTCSLQVDVTAINTKLQWRPPFTLRQGLAQTTSWYWGRSE